MRVEGLGNLLGNLKVAENRIAQGRIQAAQEIAALLESWAKTNAPFTDRTGNLRNSIRAGIESVSGEMVTILLSAGMEYAPYVELRADQRYAYLKPAVEQNKNRMIEIVRRQCGV